MAHFQWKQENPFDRLVFCLGWLNAFNLIFWMSILIVSSLTPGERFWDNQTLYTVYIWGWIIIIGLVLIAAILILPQFF